MEIHFHLSLAECGLYKLAHGLSLAFAAAKGSAVSGALASAAACAVAVSCAPVICRALTSGALLASSGGIRVPRSAGISAAAAVSAPGCSRASCTAGIIRAGTARISAPLAALGSSAGHNNDLFLFDRLFPVICSLVICSFVFCSLFSVTARRRRIVYLFFLFTVSRFKLVRNQLDCALLNLHIR